MTIFEDRFLRFGKVSESDRFVDELVLNFAALKEAIKGARSLCLNSGYNVRSIYF